MLTDSDHIMTVTDASQDFSQVAKAVDRDGAVVLMEDNRPKYVIASVDQLKAHAAEDTDTVTHLANEIMLEFDEAFKALSE